MRIQARTKFDCKFKLYFISTMTCIHCIFLYTGKIAHFSSLKYSNIQYIYFLISIPYVRLAFLAQPQQYVCISLDVLFEHLTNKTFLNFES